MLSILTLDHTANLLARIRPLFYAFLPEEQSMAFLEADNEGQGADFLRTNTHLPEQLREDLAWLHGFSESFSDLSVSRIRDVLLVDGDDIEEYSKVLEWGIGSELHYLRQLEAEHESIYLQQALRSAEREVMKLLPEQDRLQRIANQLPGGWQPVPTEIEDLDELLNQRRFGDLINEIGRRASWHEGQLMVALAPQQKQQIRQAIGSDISLDLRASTDMPSAQRQAIGQDPLALFTFLHEIQEGYGYCYFFLLLEALPLHQLDGHRLVAVLSDVATSIGQRDIAGAGALQFRLVLLQIAKDCSTERGSITFYLLLRDLADTLSHGLDTDPAIAELHAAANLRLGQDLPRTPSEPTAAVDSLLLGLRLDALTQSVKQLAQEQPVSSIAPVRFGTAAPPIPPLAGRWIKALSLRGYLTEQEANELNNRFQVKITPPTNDANDLLDQIDEL